MTTHLRKAGSGSVDPLIFNDVVDAEQSGIGQHVTAADIDSQAASNGDVLTADGAGNAAWEASAGGVPTSRTLTAGAALTGGGDLSANRTFDVAVDDSTIEVNADALRVKALGITDSQVAAANKDGATGTPSMRTLGTGAQQALPGNTSIPTVPSFATNGVVLGTAAAAGAASTVMRSNDTIAAFDATSPSTQAVGDSAVVGVATVAARRDHKHAMPAFATNAVVLGSSAAAGTAATLIHSDDTIKAFDTTAPTTQAFGDAAAVGTIAFAARRDHKHAMMALPALDAVAAPTDITTLNASTSAHGLLPKLPNNAQRQLDGLGAWTQTGWTVVTKTIDGSVSSNTTVAADGELTFTAANGISYEVFVLVVYVSTGGGATPDIKIGLGEDATIRGAGHGIGVGVNDTVTSFTAAAANQAGNWSFGTLATNRIARMYTTYTGGGGTFSLLWAQNTSGGNATVVKAGSILMYRVIV